MNPGEYEPLWPVDADRQRGRLSGHLTPEPIFLRPTQAEFWFLSFAACTVTVLLMTGYTLVFGLKPNTLIAVSVVVLVAGWAMAYLGDAFLRWRRARRIRKAWNLRQQ